ncbi:MAG: hypothetical protein WC955_11135 [Elusimicrobiota bacterium]
MSNVLPKNVPFSKDAEYFLKNETQFRLGNLMTERSHPITRNLSKVAEKNTKKALEQLNLVDYQIPPVFQRMAYESKLDLAIDKVEAALLRGNKIFFTGCGATGRLSIQMEATWRGFWQNLTEKHPEIKNKLNSSELPKDLDTRVFSVMAGGDFALIKSVEGYEDQTAFGKKQIRDLGLGKGDVVFSITEGGETSHVIGTAWAGVEDGADVFFVYNNPDAILCDKVIRSREVITDPRITKINLTTGSQAITGSTRMQATSSETLVVSSIMEVALYRILSKTLSMKELKTIGLDPEYCDIRHMSDLSYEIPATVRTAISDFSKIVELESEIYRTGGNFYAMDDPNPEKGYTLYIAGDKSSLIVLTDTTERSPTFYNPPFRPIDKPEAKASAVYMVLDAKDNNSAWESLLKHPIRGINWSQETYRQLLGDETFQRIKNDLPKIANEDILKFVISGEQALKFRPTGAGNLVVAVCYGDEVDTLTDKNSFVRRTLDSAREKGGKTAIVIVTHRKVDKSALPKTDIQVIVKNVRMSALYTTQAIVLKMLLNSLSTLVMVRLGRVMGNYMTYVSPSNKKLIDRATRLVVGLLGVPYDMANHYIHDILKSTEEARKAGKGLPAPVNIAVVRIMLDVDTNKAIELLEQHNGLIVPTLKASGVEWHPPK